MKSRTVIIFSCLLLLQVVLPFVDEVEAAASGEGFFVCDNAPNEGDRCDDYNSGAGDSTPNQPDWVKSEFILEMLDTSTIDMKMNWAMYEFDRETIGMNDDAYLTESLTLLGMANSCGAPADMIRNMVDETLGGHTV